jgi:UDP-glucuronate decarboxylase
LKKRIAVTGGAGFLGSNLCVHLLKLGEHVTCVDNFSSGSLSNIEDVLHHPQFRLIEHDITLPFEVDVDQIYNLACPASPAQYQTNPIRVIRTNVEGVINVLEAAKAVGARVLQASTSEVYGEPACHPQEESYWGNVNPLGPRACYDEGKRCAETLFAGYSAQFGVPVRVARIFNTYGPRMLPGDGRVVSNFIVNALNGTALSVHGDGSQTRSFCYVDDMVQGLVALMEFPREITGPVNLGNPQEISMAELARVVIQACGSPSSIQLTPRPTDDPTRRCPSIAKAQSLLDWKPSVPLEEGLRRTIAYFRRLTE